MNNTEEIEVEVVEIVDHQPSSHPGSRFNRPAPHPNRHDGNEKRRPFSGRISFRSQRIPVYLWPLAVVIGLILLMLAVLAVLVAAVIIIPFLVIRAIARLLLGSSRQH